MDESKYLDEFFQFLVADKVWTGIVSDIQSLRAVSEDEWFECESGFQHADYYDRIEFDLFRTFSLMNGATVFEDRILKRFPFPPITKFELWGLARTHLSGMHTPEEILSSRTRFVAHVAEATNYRSEDIKLTADIPIGSFLCPNNDCEPIWESNYGFHLSFRPQNSLFESVQVNAWAKMSEGACKDLERLLQRVAPSAAITIQLQFADVATSVESEFSPGAHRLIPFDFEEANLVSSFRSKSNVFFDFLDAYFAEPSKKSGTFNQRLRNAAHLLVEADSQSSDAIGLALSFSAIEALVCEKSEGIVDELSRHVATLLEPNALERPESIKVVKQFYSLRSKTLHGDRIDGDLDARWIARALASAIFAAAVEWKRNRLSLGSEIDRGNFISELRDSSSTGQKIAGVPTDLNRFIPTQKNRTPRIEDDSETQLRIMQVDTNLE